MKRTKLYLLLLLLFPAFTSDGAVVLFGRMQKARGTPFDPTGSITSTNVQDAIVEVLSIANSNDRYPIQAKYNGNANNGRYLEVFDGINTSDAPFVVPENSNFVTVTMGSVNSSGAFSMGFFTPPNAATPFYTASFVNGVNRLTVTGLSIPLLALDEIGVRVVSGSRNKPFVRFWLQTNL